MKYFNKMDAIRVDKKEFIHRLNNYGINTFGMHIISIAKNIVVFSEYPRDRVTTIIKKLNTIKGKYIYLHYKYSDNFRYLIESPSWTKYRIISLKSFKYIKRRLS